MTVLNSSSTAIGTRSALVARLTPALYAATLFLSALLLFAVQPMFTKMVLPRLGGSPSVWSVAMVAFQAFLFVGYVYAHVLARTLAPGRAALLHLLVLAVVSLTLPLGIAAGYGRPPVDGVTPWLIGLFAASIGLPFAALSASAPLLQNWFVATGHAQARNPYVLYAASNLGSFAALIAYPFLVEPFFSLGTQAWMWSIGFCALVVVIGVSGAVAAGRGMPVAVSASGERPGWTQRLTWLALCAVPAGLGIAVTSFITTDIAAAPFFWILPLALYLLTFVAVFRDRPWVASEQVLRFLPYVLAPLAISLLGGDKAYLGAVTLLHLIGFTMLALACHGEAYRRRPEPGRLTEFYLWTSFGGVIGGIFAGLAAPHLFANIYEYPVLIVAALLVLPGALSGGGRAFVREAGPVLAIAAVLALTRLVWDVRLPDSFDLPIKVLLVMVAAVMLLLARRPARFLGLVVLCFVVTGLWLPGTGSVLTTRSFFGVHRVVDSADGNHRILYHGTTIHGAERVRAADGQPQSGRPEPLTYYYVGGPISDAVAAARAVRGRLDNVAVVGLGTGSLACHRQGDEAWTYFEIDPEVIGIARSHFGFLRACAPDSAIVTGDARLTLAAAPARYDLIVLDAFSSDAIPVHLLTREAFAGYLGRLAPHGVMAVHVSNRHMELAGVVARVGAAAGLIAWVKQDDGANDLLRDYRSNAQVVVLARAAADVGDLPQRAGWRRLDAPADVSLWTDDYADVLAAILRKKWGG
jgi:spermidine synthase